MITPNSITKEWIEAVVKSNKVDKINVYNVYYKKFYFFLPFVTFED